jgi:catechol 2,3-dioxygenase-like lactoylglutathione lyase family enzyme
MRKLTSTVLNATDPHKLAEFYSRLLGWPITTDEDGWVTLRPGDGIPGLSFQDESRYVRPTWPAADGEQQMMMHLDVEVDDLDAAVTEAVALGATLHDHQPQEGVRVMLDPDGHPFCLWIAS